MATENLKIPRLRELITESLRVQIGTEAIDYINVGNALSDAMSRQNHVIFARRGCGKTLLLHHSAKKLPPSIKTIYLNCEEFKHHSFPNVLIEIMRSLFLEMNKNCTGWFGKKPALRRSLDEILLRFSTLRREADVQEEDVKTAVELKTEEKSGSELKAQIADISLNLSDSMSENRKQEISKTFRSYRNKLKDLDLWLPDLKREIRTFFELSKNTKYLLIQVDDLYHLKREDQAFVVDYIHRLCKDVPLFFKIATLRHASTLYADRQGQPIGAQERHDYQPINIDYTFVDYKRTEKQNWEIFKQFGERAGMNTDDLSSLFKGEGFTRLIIAGGGVPRDVLSLFLEVLDSVQSAGPYAQIGKDEVRILSRSNFERRINELKQDSQGDEQDILIKGIYLLRQFCLEKQSNIFSVSEQFMQQNDSWKSLLYRLLDYRIIHQTNIAATHKSVPGTFQAFAIDIGCYAHLRKLEGKFNEIDVSENNSKEKMRSAPVLDDVTLKGIMTKLPTNVELALLGEE